jgi:hypothetical protein
MLDHRHMLMGRQDRWISPTQVIGNFVAATLQGIIMKIDGYSSDELKSFHRVLQAAMAEIRARRADYPVSTMIARLFEAADNGERDPARLRSAILGTDGHASPADSRQDMRAARTSTPFSSRPRFARPESISSQNS